jgi:hypothetical protein
MNKIEKAQQLADQLIDECICQVGGDKGALKDEPESLVKSLKDIKKAVSMESDADKITKMVASIAEYLGEAKKEVKVSDVPKDKQEIFKINRGKARIKGGALTKAEKGGKPVKEADQVATAQQKDTLFDKLERVVKDSGKLKATITTEPTTEAAVTEASLGAKIQRGIARNDRNLRLGNKMDPKAKANAKKRKEPTTEGWANDIARALRSKAGMSTNKDKKKDGKKSNQSSAKFYDKNIAKG